MSKNKRNNRVVKCEECGISFVPYEVLCFSCKGEGCHICEDEGFILEMSLCRNCYERLTRRFDKVIRTFMDSWEKI